VAVVNDRLLSIFDGQTEYPLHEPRFLKTGIWVCPSITEVVSHAYHLPRVSALHGAPRAILRVLCWNADGTRCVYDNRHGGVDKMRATVVLPVALLPFSAESPLQPPTSGSYGTTPSTHRRAEVRGPRGPEAQLDARRTYGSGSRWRTRMQAQTVQLHEDVALMEERLLLTRAMQTPLSDSVVAAAADQTGMGRPNWRQRALSASAPPVARTAKVRERRPPLRRTV